MTVNVSNPPLLTAVAGATMSWTTNEASDTQVEYGLTTGAT
jgi:hypothetical protein